jgi:magnesium transporter
MFRTLEVAKQGTDLPVVTDGTSHAEQPPAGTIRWVDVERQDDTALALLRERFDFHPLALEDCAKFDQRPKLEEYGTYLFIVVHGFKALNERATDVEPLEVHAFLGKNYLVTVHAKPIAELDMVWKRVTGDAVLARRGADFIYYQLVDAIVDGNFVILDTISDTLDHIEDMVLHRHDREQLGEIFQMKKTLVAMRRVLSPQRDVFGLLAKRGHPCISDRTSLYFRDVYDHLVRIYESIDTGRDLLGNALDAYLSMVAQRTNEIMKRLTVLSAIFLPLTFVTGFFGQNFAHLPFANDALMWSMLAACVVIPGGMVLWFYKSRWLE